MTFLSAALFFAVVVGPEHVVSADTAVFIDSASGPGQVMLCWMQEKQIHAARVDSAGERIGSERTVAPSDGIQYFPQIAFDGAHYLVVWIEEPALGAASGKLLGRLLNADGSPASDTITISDSILLREYPTPPYPAALVWNGTRYLAIWAKADNAVAAIALTADGRIDREVPLPLRPGTIPHPTAAAAANANGETLVTWPWQSVEGATVGIDATVIDRQLVARKATTIALGSDYSPTVAGGIDGFFAAWRSSNATEIRGALVDGDGSSGAAMVIDRPPDSDSEGVPKVTFDGSGYVVAWSRATEIVAVFYSSGIFGARVTGSGEVTDRFVVAPRSENPLTTPSDVSLSALQRGRVLAAYDPPEVLTRTIDVPIESRRRAIGIH